MANYLYLKIKDYVAGLAAQNRGNPTLQLPSENQLAMKFNASRVSVRKALDELAREGVITKIKGKGTFPLPAGQATPEGPLLAFVLPRPQTSFISGIVHGATSYCRETGCRMVTLYSFDTPKLEEEAILQADSLGCAGLGLLPIYSQNYSETVLRRSIHKKPTVIIDRKLYGLNFPYVASNHYEILYRSVRYLCGKGHTGIAFVVASGVMPSSLHERIAGYEDGLERCLGQITKYALTVDFTHKDEAEAKLTDFFTRNPNITAVIMGSGEATITLYRAMQALGKTPMHGYELLLIDEESEYLNGLFGITLPVVMQDSEAIGYQSAHALHNAVLTGSSGNESIIVPVRTNFD